MPAGLDFLNVLRVNKVMQQLQDKREMPTELMFNKRIPDVPSTEGEILARIVNRPQIADIVSDDAVAAVYKYGKMTFESTPIPNLKHGQSLNQEQINQLMSMMGPAGVGQAEFSAFTMTETNILDSLRLGVEQRKEALKIAMCLDGFNYKRLGMNIENSKWGMPADLNVTPVNPWTDPVNATSIDDILSVLLYGRTRYGVNYNRVTMSTPAFRYLIKTANYQAIAKQFIPAQLTFSNLNILNLGQQQALFEATTGCTLIRYDSRYWSQDSIGNMASYPYLPINKVIIDDSAADGDANTWNFAQVPSTESIMGSKMSMPGMQGMFSGPVNGTAGYATMPTDMNPPSITYWAVARGWPRKVRLQANAVLTVGTFSDQIPIGEPF